MIRTCNALDLQEHLRPVKQTCLVLDGRRLHLLRLNVERESGLAAYDDIRVPQSTNPKVPRHSILASLEKLVVLNEPHSI